jgi:hypothetical protein
VETRDRIATLALVGAAAAAWLVALIVMASTDPRRDPVAGFAGALALGLAAGLTAAPLAWLAVFARNRRIAFRGDWRRAARRGGWVGLVVAVFVALRLQGALEPPIALFVLAMVALAETTLSGRS